MGDKTPNRPPKKKKIVKKVDVQSIDKIDRPKKKEDRKH